jgi:hypothetical protein
MFLLREIFGVPSRIYIDFACLNWGFKSYFGGLAMYSELELERHNRRKYIKDLETARGVIESAIDSVRRRGVDAVFEGDLLMEVSGMGEIESLIDNKLRKAFRTKPKNENEVQDKLEVLFLGAGLKFTREKERISYSTKMYQPDFVFGKIDTVVEVKLCNRKEREKELIGEINDYIIAFGTKYSHLIFVVYDVGIIRDEEEFIKSFQKQKVIVKIVKQ